MDPCERLVWRGSAADKRHPLAATIAAAHEAVVKAKGLRARGGGSNLAQGSVILTLEKLKIANVIGEYISVEGNEEHEEVTLISPSFHQARSCMLVPPSLSVKQDVDLSRAWFVCR